MALLLSSGAVCPLRRCMARAWRSACSLPAHARARAAVAPPAAALHSSLRSTDRVVAPGRRALRLVHAAAGGAAAQHAPAQGRLHLIIGPMFAGKTTALLDLVDACEAEQQTVVLVKSDRDSRYSTSEVVSHDGRRRACHAVRQLADLRSRLSVAEFEAADVIAVDEAQFFSDLKAFCVEAADKHHKTVLVAGLDGDFRREAFGQILSLVPHADEVTKKQGVCQRCRQKSLFSLRIVADSRTELVGGSESYEPACRSCFNNSLRGSPPPLASPPSTPAVAADRA